MATETVVTETATVNIRDRIKSLRRVKASDLRANPANWREHPENQKAAMSGILAEVGYVDALIARETPEGLELIDGHLRQDLAGDEKVPVLIVELTDEEADKVLATFDPIGAMANTNIDLLAALSDHLDFDHEALDLVVDDVLGTDPEPPTGADIPDDNYSEQYGVIVICESEADQELTYNKLEAEGYNTRVVTT
jgi:hypothetical protein